MITLDWWILPLIGVVCFLLGAVIVKQFGNNWLGLFAWAVGDQELEMFARMMWEIDFGRDNPLSSLIAAIKRLRFHNNVDEFIAWVLEQAHKLGVEKRAQLRATARTLGVQSRANRD